MSRATTKSRPAPLISAECNMVRRWRNRGLLPRSLRALAFCVICSFSGYYAPAATVEQELHNAARVAAQDAFVRAQAAYTNDPGSFEAAWHFGRRKGE